MNIWKSAILIALVSSLALGFALVIGCAGEAGEDGGDCECDNDNDDNDDANNDADDDDDADVRFFLDMCGTVRNNGVFLQLHRVVF